MTACTSITVEFGWETGLQNKLDRLNTEDYVLPSIYILLPVAPVAP